MVVSKINSAIFFVDKPASSCRDVFDFTLPIWIEETAFKHANIMIFGLIKYIYTVKNRLTNRLKSMSVLVDGFDRVLPYL